MQVDWERLEQPPLDQRLMPAADSAWLASEWVALPHEEQSVRSAGGAESCW